MSETYGNGTDRRPPTVPKSVDVLLVDDDETWVDSTARILDHQREAFSVETATDLSTAAAAIDERDPDCVVCDYQLEERTGLDLLTDIRSRDDDRPFILITGEGSESVASDAIGRQVTDYIPKRSLGGRNDLLARRVETAVESHRTREALARERRSKDAMLDILTATASREELLGQFCDHLVRERGYDGAWIGTTTGSGSVVPRAAAGLDGYLDAAIDPGVPPGDGTEPALVALSSGESHAVGDVDRPTTGSWRDAATEAGFARAAATPITHEGTTLGVLAVYGSTPGVDAGELDLLEEYGETIGYALRATGWRESLLSPTPATLELELRDGDVPLVALDRTLPTGSQLDVLTTVPGEETLLYVLDCSGTPAARLREGATGIDGIEELTVTRPGEPLRCELAVSRPTPETLLGDHGGRITDVTVAHGGASVTVVCRDETGIESLVEATRSVYPDASVRSVRASDAARPTENGLLESLTDKQRRAAELAYFNGYFQRPREHDTSEVAAKLDISRQTFTQHLRSAQRKLFSDLFESGDPGSSGGTR